MAEVAVEFTMTPEQRIGLRRAADARDISVQELLEETVFGYVRPRKRPRRKRPAQVEELPIAG